MTSADFSTFLSEHTVSIIYFSHEECNVCKVLRPKIISMVNSDFPKAGFMYLNTKEHPADAAQKGIFTVPVVLIFINGKEYKRHVRVFGLNEISESLEKAFSTID